MGSPTCMEYCKCSVKQAVRYFIFSSVVFECILFLLASIHTLNLPVRRFSCREFKKKKKRESVLHFQQIAPVMQKHYDGGSVCFTSTEKPNTSHWVNVMTSWVMKHAQTLLYVV